MPPAGKKSVTPSPLPRLYLIHASAGSGKTYELTSRFVSRLAGIKALTREQMALAASTILAVTFTNAAANEMRERVLSRLKKIALGLEAGEEDGLTPERARAWLDVFLYDTAVLNIRTIDSLLHQIVRASSLILGLPPDYEIIFEPAEALRPVFQEHLEKIGASGEQRDLFQKACRAVLEKGSLGFGKGKVLVEKIENVMKAAIAGAYRDMPDDQDYESMGKSLADTLQTAAARFLELVDKEQLVIPGRSKSSLVKYSRGEFNKSMPAALQGSKAEKLFGEADLAECIRESFAGLYEAAREYHAFVSLQAESRRLTPLLAFANTVAADFLDRQLKAGFFLQDFVSRYAGYALEPDVGVSDALCRMGTLLDCALIDEFQDTSREQLQALRPLLHEALSKGGTSICVGDVKQSIYGWRGGDPSLFGLLEKDAELLQAGAGVRHGNLKTNRRSLKEVVEHNNSFFAPLALEENARAVLARLLPAGVPEYVLEEEAALLASDYRDVKQDVWEEKDAGGYVSFQLLESPVADASLAEGMEQMVNVIKTRVVGKRPFSDALVLVRGAKEAEAAVRALGAANIMVITEKGLLLAQNSLVAEIVAFLEFINNVEDEVSLWTVLRGDIVGGMEGASALRELDAGAWLPDDERSSLYKRMQKNLPEVWKEYMAPFYSQAGLWSVYDIVHEIYVRFELERRFPEHLTMLRRFLEVAHQLENEGLMSLSDFLQYWRTNGEREKAPLPEKMDAVRIMTIHKAKGLQAPVVIIPTTRFAILPPDVPVLETMGGTPVPVKSKVALGAPHFRRMAAQARETINLLYVAMTRAEEELYVFHPAKEWKARFKSLDMGVSTLLELAHMPPSYTCGYLPGAGDEGAEAPGRKQETAVAPQQDDSCQEESKPQTSPAEFPADWLPMKWLPHIRIFRNQLDRTRLSPTERGTLAHAALERLNFDRPPREGAMIALEMASRALGMVAQPEEQATLVEGISWFASQPQARKWREHGLPEQPLMTADGREIRADLILVSPAGPIVLDYKTGQPHEHHVEQVQEYLKTLNESGQFSGNARGFLVYLDLQCYRPVSVDAAGEMLKDAPDF